MDETYLLVAARHMEFTPVRAALVENPWEYQWSSASAYSQRKMRTWSMSLPLLEIADDWRYFLSEDISEQEREVLRQYERNGRLLGSEHFVQTVEKSRGQMLRPQKPGPKKRDGLIEHCVPRTTGWKPVCTD